MYMHDQLDSPVMIQRISIYILFLSFVFCFLPYLFTGRKNINSNKNVKRWYTTIILLRCGQIPPSKIDEICPLAIPNQISLISMHVPSLVKILWHLLKLLSRTENMGMSQAHKSLQSQIRFPQYQCTYQFGENPLIFTQVIMRNWKTDGQTDGQTDMGLIDGQTHGHQSLNHNTPPLLCGWV